MLTLPITLILLFHSIQSPEPDLATVIHRANEYVAKYETELGNLIGTEKYVQMARPLSAAAINSYLRAISAAVPRGIIANTSPRITMTTSADFMLIKVGSQWMPLREVNKADFNGVEVRQCGEKISSESAAKCPKKQQDFETAFDDSPENNTKLFNGMKADSVRYNIGHILRESSLPTFALQIFRADETPRFSFEKDGSEKINGVPAWRVRFRETTGTPLVNTRAGEPLNSTGTVWIDPETGRILKTEFRVENRFATPPISTNVVVTYEQDKARSILLPSLMTEHYETSQEVIDCHSEYSNFRPFTVDIKLDVAPAKPTP